MDEGHHLHKCNLNTHTHTNQSTLQHNYTSVLIHTGVHLHQPGGDIDKVGWSFESRNKLVQL